MPPIRQGLESSAKEAVEFGLIEREGLLEAIIVLEAYVKEIYSTDCPPSMKMTIDKLKDKLEIVEDHLKHYRALMETPGLEAVISHIKIPSDSISDEQRVHVEPPQTPM